MRLPVVGLTIALLCLIAFLFTWVFASRTPDLAAWHELETYYSQHPYLELPELARGLPLEAPEDEVAPPPDDVRRAEQAELDRLFERVLQSTGGAMRRFSLVPARGFAQPGWVTSFFLHFGWLHLLGNLLFLYITAPLLEDAWGRLRFLGFYVAGGLAANVAQYALAPHAAVSIAGASGAIAACMGAYSVRFAAQKVRMMYFIWLIRIWVGTAMVPAWVCGVAWFARELLSLAGGGAEGVATGAHVGGFVLGAGVALGMRGLGFEKELLTAEEAELDTSHKADLMQTASIAAARGELDAAREHLVELLTLVPGREDAEALLAEVDLKLGKGSARLERALRKLIAKKDTGGLVGTLLRVWPYVDPKQLSQGFTRQLVKVLTPLNNPRLEPILDSLGAEPEPAPVATGPDATTTPVQFQSVSREGLALLSDGQHRLIPWGRILAVHAGVAPVDGRRVLFVDLVVRRSPPLALRLTSDDSVVPALFPGTPPPQAWRTFVSKLVNSAKATPLPEADTPAFATFDSPEAVTASWASWAVKES